MTKTVLLARPHPFIVAEMKPLLEHCGYADVQATIMGVAAGNENAAALGKPETFLYLCKDDLADPARRAIASRMVQRHFR